MRSAKMPGPIMGNSFSTLRIHDVLCHVKSDEKWCEVSVCRMVTTVWHEFSEDFDLGRRFPRAAMTRKMIALGVARTPTGMKKARDIAGLLTLSVIHLLGIMLTESKWRRGWGMRRDARAAGVRAVALFPIGQK